MRVFTTLACLIAAAVTCGTVSASTVVFHSDAELIVMSERVVHAKVVAQRTERGGPERDRIYTVTTMAVLEDFTANDARLIDVWELGGTASDEFMFVGGAVQYEVGREVVVCLERGPQGLRTVALGLSKFDVQPGASDERMLTRNLRGVEVVGGSADSTPRTLSKFRQLAAQIVRRPSRRYQAPVTGESVTASAAFTFLSDPPLRWAEADFGVPVFWYRNVSAPAPLLSGNGANEIQTALAGWTNPPSASITLQYGGTSFQTNPTGPWNGLGNGSGVITFEDPSSDVPSGALAIGGGVGTTGSGGSIHGQVFDGFTRAYVIFQKAARLPSNIRQSLDFSRVMEHEIGHGMGLGHTDSSDANIMYASCCSSNMPVPPALGPDDLAGLNYLYPAITPGGPTMSVDQTSLNFGAITNGANVLTQTSAQIVRLTQAGAGAVTWSAVSTVPWIQVSPASGAGSATLSVAVVPAAVPASGTLSGSIELSFVGAGNVAEPLSVVLKLIPNGTSSSPFGVVDTPLDNASGVTGAVPVTGWALDDVEVASVTICRAAVTGESVASDARCGGAQVFLGSGVFIDGARPDVQAAYPTAPRKNLAGWGFMILTNMLPNQGNGVSVVSVYATDREGRVTVLGTRTMTCANAQATAPFGTIDTPGQGDTVSGSQYVNFGWALTQNPKVIPFDGSTLQVYVDGVAVGSPSYNHYRSDIATLFPGLANSNGAVGFRIIDTTTLSNGLHTIVWTATDSAGSTAGVGSRFFRVSNGVNASVTAAASAAMTSGRSAAVLDSVPVDPSSIVAQRSWDPEAPWRAYAVGRADRIVVRGEEIDRFEIELGAHAGEKYTGYVRVGDELSPLPIGSQLDVQTGAFTWSPGVGFVGTYDLVFVRSAGERRLARREVRIILQPKGSGHVGAQVVIDTPRSQQAVAQPFLLGGWAADLDAAAGTGIDTLHVWAYPLSGDPPVFLGTATYGGARPDVVAIHGDQFRESGYGLLVQGLTPGNYDLAVFAWSNVSAGFVPASVVRVTVR
jgi:Matrixin